MKYLQVSDNGFIMLDGTFANPTPLNFPMADSMIIPLWADVDLRYAGEVWYRITTDETIKQQAIDDVKTYFPGFKDFQASWILIATWENVPFYGCISQSVCSKVVRRTFRFRLSVFILFLNLR